jgi:hypothetical protein
MRNSAVAEINLLAKIDLKVIGWLRMRLSSYFQQIILCF